MSAACAPRGSRAPRPPAAWARTRTRRERAAAHVVDLHRQHVVARHQAAGQMLEHGGLQPGESVGQRDHRALEAEHRARVLHEFAQRVHGRSAQVVAFAEGPRCRRGSRRSRAPRPRRTRAGTSRRRSRAAARGTTRASCANRLRNPSPRPNTTEGRKIVVAMPCSAAPAIAASPCALLRWYSLGASAAAPSELTCSRRFTPASRHADDDAQRQFDVIALEAVVAAVEHAHQVDRRRRSRRRRCAAWRHRARRR